MHRTEATNKEVDKFGSGKHGHRDRVVGPPLVPGTIVDADLMDALQEEIANAVELSGTVLNSADNTQLFGVIDDVRTTAEDATAGPASATDNAIARFNGTTGKIVQNSAIVVADSTGDMSGVGTISYGSTKNHAILISVASMQPYGATTLIGRATDGSGMIVDTDSAEFMVDLGPWLTNRCTITGFSLYVNPGAARAGVNRMMVELWRVPHPAAAVQIGSTVWDDATANTQLLSGSVSQAVDRSTNTYCLKIKVGNDAATNQDSILYAAISVGEAGPGFGS